MSKISIRGLPCLQQLEAPLKFFFKSLYRSSLQDRIHVSNPVIGWVCSIGYQNITIKCRDKNFEAVVEKAKKTFRKDQRVSIRNTCENQIKVTRSCTDRSFLPLERWHRTLLTDFSSHSCDCCGYKQTANSSVWNGNSTSSPLSSAAKNGILICVSSAVDTNRTQARVIRLTWWARRLVCLKSTHLFCSQQGDAREDGTEICR